MAAEFRRHNCVAHVCGGNGARIIAQVLVRVLPDFQALALLTPSNPPSRANVNSQDQSKKGIDERPTSWDVYVNISLKMETKE
jgi:hypothetical protein